jgi:hypothetical protein
MRGCELFCGSSIHASRELGFNIDVDHPPAVFFEAVMLTEEVGTLT